MLTYRSCAPPPPDAAAAAMAIGGSAICPSKSHQGPLPAAANTPDSAPPDGTRTPPDSSSEPREVAAAPPSGEHERAMLAGLKVAELRSLLEGAGLAVATKITKAELLRQVEAAAAVGSLSLEADADAAAAPPMSQSRPKRARAAVEETPAPVSASVRKGKRAKAMADEEPPSSARRSTRARR